MYCRFCGRRIKKGDYVFVDTYCCRECLDKIIDDCDKIYVGELKNE